jgi:hypothetical protein
MDGKPSVDSTRLDVEMVRDVFPEFLPQITPERHGWKKKLKC